MTDEDLIESDLGYPDDWSKNGTPSLKHNVINKEFETNYEVTLPTDSSELARFQFSCCFVFIMADCLDTIDSQLTDRTIKFSISTCQLFLKVKLFLLERVQSHLIETFAKVFITCLIRPPMLFSW